MMMLDEKIISEDVNKIIEKKLPWESFYGCTVVVTGASGFIGSYIVKTFLALNNNLKYDDRIKVIALVRDMERADFNLKSIKDNPSLSFFLWDLSDISVPDLGDCNYIIHAASHASPKFYGVDPVGTILPNTIGIASLMTAFRKSKDPKGFLFISSSEVYGEINNDTSIDENTYGYIDPLNTRSCYAESKRAGETMCKAWYTQYSIPIFIVRPFHTYGPGLRPDDGRVFADFCFNIIENKPIEVKSDGKAIRAFCYVSDAIAGFFYVLLKGEVGIAYNVANPKGKLSIKELALLLSSFNKFCEIKSECSKNTDLSYLKSDVKNIIPDTRLISQLGWVPDIDPKQGFKRMIEAYNNDR